MLETMVGVFKFTKDMTLNLIKSALALFLSCPIALIMNLFFVPRSQYECIVILRLAIGITG